jgi:aminopeptidase N
MAIEMLINSLILAASVFRMLLRSLSETTFTEGLKIYLSQSPSNPTGVTAQRDLYDAWQRAAGTAELAAMGNYKVEELFGSWERPGYPVLHVERSYNDHRVRFTQVRAAAAAAALRQ